MLLFYYQPALRKLAERIVLFTFHLIPFALLSQNGVLWEIKYTASAPLWKKKLHGNEIHPSLLHFISDLTRLSKV